ncbi:MAG: hypothetical protein QOK16_2278 [Solirubrobacteraceae bacterium]|jgi:hypothetical protein|nr:hypothetical protein [Solirubrobacteraceae bacterium]MEA2187267.1 hypothetical protein [Solirubrobacteraceae bacterium]
MARPYLDLLLVVMQQIVWDQRGVEQVAARLSLWGREAADRRVRGSSIQAVFSEDRLEGVTLGEDVLVGGQQSV